MTSDAHLPVPDPELLDIRDAGISRTSLERFGVAVWTEALDWLYGEAMMRPILRESYPDSRRRFFGPSNEPAPAPDVGSPADAVLAEFRERVAPMTFNAQFPGAFSYFTPPPLAMSIGGEVLAQWLHQGVDVWHAGPIGGLAPDRRRVGSGLMGCPHFRWCDGEPDGARGGSRHPPCRDPR